MGFSVQSKPGVGGVKGAFKAEFCASNGSGGGGDSTAALDDCQQWQSNYPSVTTSTIFKYFSMKSPIMEATAVCYNSTDKHNIKTEDTEANNQATMATASSMASMAAAATCMFNRLHDTANFTSR